MTSDRKNLVRDGFAGVLMVAGVLIGIFHALIFDLFLAFLPCEARLKILPARNLYVAIPLGIGLALFLIGVFYFLFSGPAWGSLSRRLLSFLPSGKLLGTLFLFLLPWVNIQCHYRQHDDRRPYNSIPGNDLVAYQTGLQLAYGGYTGMQIFNPFRPQIESVALAVPPQPAPLVAAAGLAVLVGVAGGLLLRRRLSRFAVLPACSLVAFLLLFLQSQREFPISAGVAAENREMLRNPQFAEQGGLVCGPPQLVLDRTWWYHAAMALPLAAVLAAGADWLVRRKKTAIQFQETVVLVALAALGSLTLPIAMHEYAPAGSAPTPAHNGTTTRHEEARAATLPPEKEIAFDLGAGVKLEMVLIPAGEFLMGSPDSDQGASSDFKPQHHIRITKSFYLGKYSATQEQWEAVMGNNPSRFKGPKNPVEDVSWEDCQKFLGKLNAKVGGGKFRLPTEAQWEYACRAGSTTRYCFGDDESKLGENAWYVKNSGNTSHPVGEKKPNAWGLYDMHGTVWQWCADWWGWYDARSITDDPTGPPTGLCRVFRGGSWGYDAEHCWSASRGNGAGPDSRRHDLGLRVCLVSADK